MHSRKHTEGKREKWARLIEKNQAERNLIAAVWPEGGGRMGGEQGERERWGTGREGGAHPASVEVSFHANPWIWHLLMLQNLNKWNKNPGWNDHHRFYIWFYTGNGAKLILTLVKCSRLRPRPSADGEDASALMVSSDVDQTSLLLQKHFQRMESSFLAVVSAGRSQ